MESVVEDFKAKNFDLEIEGSLYAVNRGLDFSGFLDVDQALGARMLMDILKDLDDDDIKSWTIHGWYPRYEFGEDYDGVKDDVSFINEAYFTNERLMDELWYKTPCLTISKGNPSSRYVWIGVDDAPYIRHTIMEHIVMKRVTILNDDSFPFPGEDAIINVFNDGYKTEHGRPYSVKFRMPEAFYIRYDGKEIWKFVTPKDREKMRAELHEMEREYWDNRR